MNNRFTILVTLLVGLNSSLLAFESTKVLPKGIRNLNLRTLYTTASTKTDKDGNIEPLAEALWKPLKFKNILSSETGLKKKQLEALLLQQGWSTEDSVGDFRAELDAQINVWAPIFAYGITEKITLAAALPIYSASTDIQIGFKTNDGAKKLIAALTDPTMSNNKSAVEVVEKFQNFESRLNKKLLDNGYEEFSKWNSTGIGDLTLLAKYLALDHETFKLAISGGVVVPTGKQDNPDILTDLPFGDGQWDIISQLTAEQFITSNLSFSQFAKYTYQSPDKKNVRLKTGDETIEVDTANLDYKLGDKIDAGLAVQYEQPMTGFQAGVGLLTYRKFGDRYETDDLAAKDELQRATDHDANYWQAKFGYSTLGAFKRGEFAVPLMASIEYRKQEQSRNVPRTDFTQIDIRLFF